MIGDPLRPVLSLEGVLDALEACRDPGDPRRGPLRQSAWNLARALPPGALDAGRALRLRRRFVRLVDTEPPFPARVTIAPPPARGVTYWLSSHDELGAVLRVRLQAREEGERPFGAFWPSAAVDQAAEAAARDAYRAAARVLGTPPLAPLLGWHRLEVLDPRVETLPGMEGGSLGAPLALMLLSLWTDTPLPQDRAVTGHIDGEGRLFLPGNDRRTVAAKVAALRRERPSVRVLYLPAGTAVPDASPLEVVEVEDLRALARAFGLSETHPAYPTTIEGWLEAAHEARWLDRSRPLPAALLRGRLEALAVAVEPLLAPFGERPPWALREAVTEVQVLLCRYRLYAGDREGATAIAADLQWLLEADGEHLPSAVLARLVNALASLLIELGRPDEASRYTEVGVRQARAAKDPLEEARVLTTRGRAAAHAGDDARAIADLQAAARLFDEVAPWEDNICRCATVATLTRLGRREDARALLEASERRNEQVPGIGDALRKQNALYLANERLRLALTSGEGVEAAIEEAETRLAAAPRAPWPDAVLLARLVEAHLAIGDLERAETCHRRLDDLVDTFPVEIVALYRDRAAVARLAHALSEGQPPAPAWLDALERWRVLRALHGPPAATASGQAILAGHHPPDAEALHGLLAAEVY